MNSATLEVRWPITTRKLMGVVADLMDCKIKVVDCDRGEVLGEGQKLKVK